MEDQGPGEAAVYHLLPEPSNWFGKFLTLQADIIYNCMVSLSSPICSLVSAASESYHRAEETKATVEAVVHDAPSNITHASAVLLKKVALGFMAAAHVGMLLLVLMVLASLVGFGLVRLWLEEPVLVKEKLFFDYTRENPSAVFSFAELHGKSSKQIGIPAGHTFHVSLILLVPESDFNRQIGVFQLTAEIISRGGHVKAKSSQPCMLRFRSLPIRLARTFLMGIPILLGISSESQEITVGMLKHKEGYPRTEAVKLTMAPRAGTSSLPQIYQAEILIKSQLPWTKQLAFNWKWTLYVWTSLYVYIVFLAILLCCFKPLLFPFGLAIFSGDRNGVLSDEVRESPQSRITTRDDTDVSELIRKWQESRNKRKAILEQSRAFPATTVGSSAAASSMTVSREMETSAVVEGEEIGDSESVFSSG